jgi:tetratricopeptide (TPR) repeat protein
MRIVLLRVLTVVVSLTSVATVLGLQESATYAEEYELYQKAEAETDVAKQQRLLIQFVETYNESVLDPNISYLYGLSYAAARERLQWQQLANLAENYLRYRSDDLAATQAATEAYQNLGNSRKLVDFGAKLYADSPNANTAYFVAKAYQSLNDQANFLKWEKRTVQHDPNNLQVLVELSNTYWRSNDFPNTDLYARKALQATENARKPESQSEQEWNSQLNRTRGFCYRAIAEAAYVGKNTNKARDNFETSIRYHAHNDFAHYRLGLIYWGKRRNEEAIESLAKAVALNGTNLMKAKYELDRLYVSLYGSTDGLRTILQRARVEMGSH